MCGIFGVVGDSLATYPILEGLHRLEYRGYDSAGVATELDGNIHVRRASGKLNALEDMLTSAPLKGYSGIGHTRWATHGQPTITNAHPHICGSIAVVHNGIVENHNQIRSQLISKGHQFSSQTDSEVIPHLIDYYYSERGLSPMEAIRNSLKVLKGSYALGIIVAGYSDQVIAARRGSPLVIGEGAEGMFLASDTMAFGGSVKDVIYLNDNDVAVIGGQGLKVYDEAGNGVNRTRAKLGKSQVGVSKEGYSHFMLKEIHEQPAVIKRTNQHVSAEMFNAVDFSRMNRLHIIACGTSYYAGAVAKYWFEKYAKLPVELDIASEFRYRSTPLMENDSALFISQSGETADTLAAMEEVRRSGNEVLSIVNVPGSSIARESDAVFYTQAGPEIGVASTKAFTTQLSLLAAMAIHAGKNRGVLSEGKAKSFTKDLNTASAAIETMLKRDSVLKDMAAKVCTAKSALYLGRGPSFPIALEGALKLKEISYIHAEGYAAGELKHGPIALVDKNTPVVMIVPDDDLSEKTASNLQEVVARGGKVFLIGGQKIIAELQEQTYMSFSPGKIKSFSAPIVYVVALQLLAYYVATIKGTDVDQPRNLAKSVTVE